MLVEGRSGRYRCVETNHFRFERLTFLSIVSFGFDGVRLDGGVSESGGVVFDLTF